MKKIFFIVTLLAASLAAHAEDYKYLTLAYNSMEKSIELGTIQKITFTDGQLVVTTSDGSETFAQNQMEKMYFSQTATNIQSTVADVPQTGTSVYDLQGRKIQQSRPSKGIYIVNGRKVVIK
ncbi:MAG: hypothetical protein IJ064_07830 [Bacteroidaceae bacterium]|nr:hypothetical protein [Bacteroidaceae bacterium]